MSKNNFQLIVKKASTCDIDEIIELWKLFMAEEKVALSGELPLANWSKRLKSQVDRGYVVIAELDKTIVGFAGFIDISDKEWVGEDVLYIVDFYVIPEARKTDAAGMLLRKLNEIAKQLNYKEFRTNTSVKNRRVQILLERSGYVPLENFKIPGLKDYIYYKNVSVQGV